MTYLVFAEEWEVEDDLEGLGVGGEHDEVGEAAVQRLRGLVGALLQLYHLTNGEDQVSKLIQDSIKAKSPVMPSIVSLETSE